MGPSCTVGAGPTQQVSLEEKGEGARRREEEARGTDWGEAATSPGHLESRRLVRGPRIGTNVLKLTCTGTLYPQDPD